MTKERFRRSGYPRADGCGPCVFIHHSAFHAYVRIPGLRALGAARAQVTALYLRGCGFDGAAFRGFVEEAARAGAWAKLKELNVSGTMMTMKSGADEGFAALADALAGGALPKLKKLVAWEVPVSAAAAESKTTEVQCVAVIHRSGS